MDDYDPCPCGEALDRVLAIQPEDHATTSRDFGRGFAYALRLVREAAEGTGNGSHTVRDQAPLRLG